MVNPIRNPMIQIFAAHGEIAGPVSTFPTYFFHICFPNSHVNPNKHHINFEVINPKITQHHPKIPSKKALIPKFLLTF